MSDLEEASMARIQVEWKEAFANLVQSAKLYRSTSVHRYAHGYQDFIELSSAAIALYQVEEHYPLQQIMEIWPKEGWEKTLHDMAVAWGELSLHVPRDGGSGEYASLSIQRMQALQHAALDAPPTSDTVHDGPNNSLGETRVET